MFFKQTWIIPWPWRRLSFFMVLLPSFIMPMGTINPVQCVVMICVLRIYCADSHFFSANGNSHHITGAFLSNLVGYVSVRLFDVVRPQAQFLGGILSSSRDFFWLNFEKNNSKNGSGHHKEVDRIQCGPCHRIHLGTFEPRWLEKLLPSITVGNVWIWCHIYPNESTHSLRWHCK